MEFLVHALLDLGSLLLKVFVIIVPLMIVLEISREFKLLDKLMAVSYPLAKPLGFGRDAIYPLVAGLIFGISYGGGVLIGESDSGRIGGSNFSWSPCSWACATPLSRTRFCLSPRERTVSSFWRRGYHWP